MKVYVQATEGLHIGATWELTEFNNVFGSDPTCAVFLCDPDIPEILLRVIIKEAWVEFAEPHSALEIKPTTGKRVPMRLLPGMTFILNYQEVELLVSVSGEGAKKDNEESYNWAQLLTPKGWVQAFKDLPIQAKITLSAVTLVVSAVVGITLALSQKPVIAKPVVVSEPGLSARQIEALILNEVDAFKRDSVHDYFELTTEGQSVNVTAAMTRASLIRFEQLYQSLVADYGQFISFTATVDLTSEQKRIDTLDVAQVILGDNPVVILDNGLRLFSGAYFQGMELTDIKADELTFQGAATYRLPL